jgi:transcriptional regulator with XRE-family HTH domain
MPHATSWSNPDIQLYAAEFGRRTAVAITAARLKKVEVSRALEVQTQLPQSWVAGRRMPSLPMLTKLCQLLDADAHWLLGLTRGPKTFSEDRYLIPTHEAHELSAEDLEALAENHLKLAQDAWRLAAERRVAQR